MNANPLLTKYCEGEGGDGGGGRELSNLSTPAARVNCVPFTFDAGEISIQSKPKTNESSSALRDEKPARSCPTPGRRGCRVSRRGAGLPERPRQRHIPGYRSQARVSVGAHLVHLRGALGDRHHPGPHLRHCGHVPRQHPEVAGGCRNLHLLHLHARELDVVRHVEVEGEFVGN